MAKAKNDLTANAVALLATKAFASKNADRKCVDDGENYPDVKLKLSGTVNKKPVSFAIAGRVSVGNPTGSTLRPSAEKVLALALDYMPKTKAALLNTDATAGTIPEPDAESLKRAKAIIQALSTTSARAGSVSFIEG
jgi:hypothetical protein